MVPARKAQVTICRLSCGSLPTPRPCFLGLSCELLSPNRSAVHKLSMAFAAAVLLGGCQDQSGEDWLDPLIVKDYSDRVELTYALKGAASYCDFGCMHLCTMVPEPQVHKQLAEQNLIKLTALYERARTGGLLLDLSKKSEPIIELLPPPELREEEIGPTKLECIRTQERRLQKIETLLNRLIPKEP